VAIPKSTISVRSPHEKALLVAVAGKNSRDRWSVKDSVKELGELSRTARAKVIGTIIQHLPAPSKAYYIGKGKIEELKSLKESKDYNLVIFDDELTPVQQRNLEDALKVKVIDRAALILDIFARHARTNEGKLQVELAQHEYLLPRLAGQWSHLERLGGGIGTRGPGESQLETDRRLISRKIHNLKKRIEELRKHRSLYRQKRRRSGIPIVSLVGYTNSGKSSLLNALSHANVLAQDKLFATLDPTTRQIYLDDMGVALLTDTVGFIRKLPPTIISAFRATLEELKEADLLIHVVDVTLHNAIDQCKTVEDILKDLGIDQKPRITALNKIDLMLDKDKEWDENKAFDFLSDYSGPISRDTILTSAIKGWGLKNLRQNIIEVLSRRNNATTGATS